MISEITLTREYTSFWRAITPMMDGFIRRANTILYQREFQPINSKTNPSRRAFVNEIAFSAFCNITSSKNMNFSTSITKEAIELATIKVRKFKPWIAGSLEGAEDLLPFEVDDAAAQVDRFESKLRPRRSSDLVLRPRFQGCGKLYDCEGDAISDKCLYEFKAGDRKFRAIDVRQAIVYCALNKSSNQFNVGRMCIFNPRLGISLELSLDELSMEISGTGSIDLFDKIIFALSGPEISGTKL